LVTTRIFSQFRAHGGFRFAGAVDAANGQFEGERWPELRSPASTVF